MPYGEMRGGILCKVGEGDRIKGIPMKGDNEGGLNYK